jgi:hypothetical protein
MKKKLINTLPVLIITVFITACEGIIADLPPPPNEAPPPFVITKPVFEVIERPSYFKCAGIVFKFFNKRTDKVVEKITVSFLLFDQKTQDSPFIGSNKFQITRWDTVLPNENKEIIISLDQFIYIAPSSPYLIDYFYIYEIHYEDSSVWQDRYGKYRVRE